MDARHFVYFEDQLAGTQRLYENPLEIITAKTPKDIPAALARIEECQAQDLYLAGYCAYELGYVLEPKLLRLLPNKRTAPLLKFGVFKAYTDKAVTGAGAHINELMPAWSQDDYQSRFDKIMAYIRAGDVYQINLTFPLRGTYQGSAAGLYQQLKAKQPVRYGGVISLGGEDIVTLSPELFFEKEGTDISMRPMKGTAKRGGSPKQDAAFAKALKFDEKNRAENLMIVDLLRNDLSRIARPGSVKAHDLFSIETYPSLHTMTSGIRAQLGDVDFAEILRALFPCGSVTGAPKIRAMEIIDELEDSPRGGYCGALGLIDPGGSMRFNVGIRTLVLGEDGSCEYRVGSGVVADSKGTDEYNECLLKASFLKDDFRLIETFGWHKQIGFMYLDLHLARLQYSARALGFICNFKHVNTALTNAAADLEGPQKIRLTLARDGAIEINSAVLKFTPPNQAWPVSLSKKPLNSENQYLIHKTTKRAFIEGELARLSKQTGCREALFFNERNELCEGSYTNVFIVKDGQMFTPSLSSGLLPGILRRVLLDSGEAKERVLTYDDVLTADEIYIGNSVRGLMRARLVTLDKV